MMNEANLSYHNPPTVSRAQLHFARIVAGPNARTPVSERAVFSLLHIIDLGGCSYRSFVQPWLGAAAACPRGAPLAFFNVLPPVAHHTMAPSGNAQHRAGIDRVGRLERQAVGSQDVIGRNTVVPGNLPHPLSRFDRVPDPAARCRPTAGTPA